MLPPDNNSTHAFDPPQIDGPLGTISSAEATIPSVVPTPTVVAGYHVERELGRGGMGVVYLATQDGLNRQVALKMVLSGEHASTIERGRFLAEAEAVAAVRHPAVVQVFDFGTHEGRLYFALEYLPGGSLATKLNGTPLPVSEAAKLVEAIARAVQAAHDAGVIHRDLKPANILYDADGTPKVTDFGLARKADTQSGLTATGAVLGTPSYMAPEQAQGRKDVGPVADVYALGAVLYECLTGRPPFRAASPLETVLQVMKDEPVPPSRFTPKLPRDLETICLKCLSKDPIRRYSTAGAMADDLKRFRDGEPILARPLSPVERSWRWVRRNPALAAVVVGGPTLLAGTVLVVLIALLTTATANVRLATERLNAENERIVAERQRGLATARLEKAIEAIDRMMTRVNSERWATNPNLQDERRQVLEEAVTFFNGFTAEDSADPRVRFETAKAHTRVAAAYLMLSDVTKSTYANRQALQLYDGLMAEYPDEASYKAGASEAFTFSGGVSSLSAQYTDVLIAYNRAVELADAAVALDPGSSRYKLRAVDARSSLAFFYLESDRAQGEKVLGPMLRLAQEIGNDPNAPFEYRVALAFTLAVAATYDQTAPKLSMVQTRTTAVDRYDDAQNILNGLYGRSAPSAHAWDQFAHTRAYVAVQRAFIAILQAVTSSQRRAAAEQMKKGLELYDTLLRVNPKAFPYRLQKYQALRSLVNIYSILGDFSASAKANATADRLIADMIRDYPHLEWLRGMDALRQTVVLIERVRTDNGFAFEVQGAKLIEIANPGNKGDVMYNVACAFAVACECQPVDVDPCVVRMAARLNGAWVERGLESRKEKYAARAVALLNDLAKTDYFRNSRRVAHLDEDSDLDALRDRDDFKAFMAVVRKLPVGRLKTQ